MKTLQLAGALIMDDSDRLLVVRKKGSPYYMMPGGKVEVDESPDQALKRELKEELNLEVELDDLELVGCHQTFAANEKGTLVYGTVFSVHVDNHDLLKPQAEIQELHWYTEQDYANFKSAHLLSEFTIPKWLEIIRQKK
ncbi:NUDIX hydrolase [Sphingobacterium hungaricum]|uniref:NUDIX hydrolase n=1 Tax=Sphingobacterium hungaricum TaxID=2082723 RepID=A0A928UV94_9SPHI|nr:NUDIX domain-containing protein [Sphingobacterium hungaricum]MBE8712191.1 NUDIX hydrolase [Sphingobacterium hungaricum]